MTSLPPELEPLIAAEQPGVRPPIGAEQRVLARMEAILPGLDAAVSSGAESAVQAGAAKIVGGKGIAMIVGAFVAGGAVGSGTTLLLQPDPMPAQPPPPLVAPAQAPELETPRPRAPEPEAPAAPSEAEPTRRTRKNPLPSSSRPATDDLTNEQTLLQRGRTALTRNMPSAALEAIQEHRRRYPRGQLREERMALHVMALVAHDEHDAATRKAAEFRRQYPKSMLWPAVMEVLREPSLAPSAPK